MILPKRKNIRLIGYDYSKNGAYFITICAQDRLNIFGEIIDGRMVINNAGQMVINIYMELENEFENIKLDKFTLMPNHFHCIINIVGAGLVSAKEKNRVDIKPNRVDIKPNRVDIKPTPTIGDIICSFKSRTTLEYINGVKNGIYPPYNKRIWQRNYYDHIIRNEREYIKIWDYIDINPLKWNEDCYYR